MTAKMVSSTYRRMRGLLLIVWILALLTQACGGGFASNLRKTLALSRPLIESLPISPDLKSGLIADFDKLISGAADLKDELDACQDKPCKLLAVENYVNLFDRVAQRGNFGAHERIQKVESILRALLEAARIYYGGPAPVRRDGSTMSPKDAEKELQRQLDELEKAMQPVVSSTEKIDCNAPRLSFIPQCDEPPDLHPCETKHHRETGGRFNVNCQTTVKN